MPELYEPLFDKKNQRFTSPINDTKYPDLWKRYEEHRHLIWFPGEIDYSGDYEDFTNYLDENEQHFIKTILAFFANSDGIVNMNLSERFTNEITNSEALVFYRFQEMMEDIHSETYKLMLDNIIRDNKEREKYMDAINTIPCIKDMADWAFKWIESDKSFGHRLIAFAAVEGIFFCGSFASIYWLKTYKSNVKKGNNSIMCGLTKSNEYISRDETLHMRFATDLYKYIVNQVPYDEVKEIIHEAVGLSQNMMKYSLPVSLLSMNETSMCQYIEYVADRLLMLLGYDKMYNSENPYGFMDTIGIESKSNFFENRSTEYQPAFTNTNDDNNDLVLMDDF